MKALFEAILAALERGEDAVLCSIVASAGSTPRGRGAKMAVFLNGSTMGTVGGGAVEYHSTLAAKEALQGKNSFLRGFDLSADQAASIGMICGGKVELYFQYFSAEDRIAASTLRAIVPMFDQNQNVWLVTRLSQGNEFGLYMENAGLSYIDLPEENFRKLLRSSGVLQDGLYVEPLVQPGFVYVFGGGHVSQELVPAIARVDFRPIVYEDREAFASPALFPSAVKLIIGPFTKLLEMPSERDYAVILTRGHQADYEVLSQVLSTKAAYIGMIGSRAKVATTMTRLQNEGVAEAELLRVHAPIGLPIEAQTPAEIAVSITAELILHRAKLLKRA